MTDSASAPAAPAAQRPGFVARYAWAVFATLSLILVLFGIGDMFSGGATFRPGGEDVLFTGVTGTTWDELLTADPGAARMIDYQVRAGGAHLLVVGVLSLWIAAIGLRRGERWAWYAMWAWPLWIVLALALLLATPREPGAGTPIPLISGTIFLVLAVAVLALSYRRYNVG